MHAWFRFYHEALEDPKVQTLSPAVFKAWVNLLCLAAKHHGKIADSNVISFALRITPAKAADLVHILESHGLLDKNGVGWEPHKWQERQYKSDDVTLRTRAFRERQQNVPKNVPGTLHGTFTGTPSESDSESEQKQKPSVGSLLRNPEPCTICGYKGNRSVVGLDLLPRCLDHRLTLTSSEKT